MSDVPTANPSGLGRLVKEYALSSARVRQILFVICLSAGMASVCWLLALLESRDSLSTRIGISILGLFVASPLFFGLRELFRLGGISLSLYENGLIYRRRGKAFRTTWDEIESYIQESTCRITKRDGEVIEFGLSLEGVEEVAQEILDQTVRRMLPQVKAIILNGSSVQFRGVKPFADRPLGKRLNEFALAYSGFAIDAQGITELEGGNRIAWKDVADYGIIEEKMGRILVDVLFIQDDKVRLRTRLGALSNAHILLALCAEMTGRHQEDAV